MVKISLFTYALGAMVMFSSVTLAKPKSEPAEGYMKTCYCVGNIYSSSSCCSKYHSNGKLNKAGSRCMLKSSEQTDLYTSCCANLANLPAENKDKGLFSFGLDYDDDDEEEENQLPKKSKKTYSCY